MKAAKYWVVGAFERAVGDGKVICPEEFSNGGRASLIPSGLIGLHSHDPALKRPGYFQMSLQDWSENSGNGKA